MILNSTDWSQKETYHADIAIVGAGAAGITLSLELEKLGFSVILLEGGDMHYSDQSQDIYNGEFNGRDLPNGLRNSRTRCLGGSTNCWAGVCVELDEEDFLKRTWVPNSGWPIKKEDLLEWYDKAAPILDIDLSEIRDPLKTVNYPLLDDLELRATTSAKKRLFAHEFKDVLEKSENIHVLVGANFTSMNRIHDGKTIKEIKIQSFDKKTASVSANTFVLTCGGIENARILLNTKTNDQEAIGNIDDNVGRYFSDHPIAPCATLLTLEGNMKESSIYNYRNYKNIFHYKIPFSLQEKFKTLNICLSIWPEFEELTDLEVAGWNINKYVKDTDSYSLEGGDIKTVLKNPLGLYRSYKSRSNMKKSRLSLRFQMEQSPDPESRISLLPEKDQFGLQRVNLHWVFSPLERHTVDIATSLVADSLHKNKIASLRLDSQLIEHRNRMPMDLRGGQHHSGSTRMAINAKDGVVDSNLKVFNTSNLFICGSSVFPTNGWANPTFTIIALTLRLAQHIKSIH